MRAGIGRSVLRFPAGDRRAVHHPAVETRIAGPMARGVHDAHRIGAELVAVVATVVGGLAPCWWRLHHTRHDSHFLERGISP